MGYDPRQRAADTAHEPRIPIIIARAEAALIHAPFAPGGGFDINRGLVRELVEELKTAHAQIERLVNLLRCAKEGCDGNH